MTSDETVQINIKSMTGARRVKANWNTNMLGTVISETPVGRFRAREIVVRSLEGNVRAPEMLLFGP